jgi:hypothetical protein
MPTIHEVADRAGVSTTTVSYVIDNTRSVCDDVRCRTRAWMSELGYLPNASARSRRRAKRYFQPGAPASANPRFLRYLKTNVEPITEKIRGRTKHSHLRQRYKSIRSVSCWARVKVTEKGGPRNDRFHEICSSCQPLIQHKEDGP